ncbi:hypothetical protein BvCmsNSP039_04576 [Escherichia coli]|nr:hypothetical protein BvCmsKKP042_00469 [Escherichia coli]GDQ50034.1 hypothetical protein BvCmsNSP039_04576 [Escherichia coli]
MTLVSKQQENWTEYFKSQVSILRIAITMQWLLMGNLFL